MRIYKWGFMNRVKERRGFIFYLPTRAVLNIDPNGIWRQKLMTTVTTARTKVDQIGNPKKWITPAASAPAQR